MRIQHNIMAMNSYRNLAGNNTALSKNLEKLSSGYRINRAGDDAAGLAISEKMRAQIAGLDQAQKNAQSGINLVKTAEGALTEVHDMLNRMVTLSTQSANGTYSATDRQKLQAEIDALTEEIDRIADNSNFNGTKLLDGSLAAGEEGGTKAVKADVSKLGIDLVANASDTTATKGKYETDALANATTDFANGDRVNFTVNFTDANGEDQSVTISLFKKTGEQSFYVDDGTEDGIKLAATFASAAATTATSTELQAALKEAMNENDTIKANFTVDVASNKFSFEARAKGSEGAVLNSVKYTHFDYSARDTGPSYGVAETASKVTVVKEAVDSIKAFDFTKDGKIWDSTLSDDTDNAAAADVMAKLEDAVFEVNGKKFVFVNKPAAGGITEDDLAAMKAAGVDHWVEVGTAGSIAAGDITKMVEKIKEETGLDVQQGKLDTNTATKDEWVKDAAAGTLVVIKDGEVKTEGTEGSELKLQIGADSVETIGVGIDSMKAKDLGIENLDIGDVEAANKAIDTIKAAIEQVSVQRGNLGAIQNRLEHTINNLGVMEENIQDAESNIRDTDVADEMMAYTKNNILIQSAQAMLAQANQVPQGVLQLMG